MLRSCAALGTVDCCDPRLPGPRFVHGFLRKKYRDNSGQKDAVKGPGAAYRREILEPNGSEDAAVLLRRFLGREPSNEAFLRDMGLKPVATG